MAILKANVYSATQNSKAASPVAPATSVIDVVKLTSLKTIFVCIVILIEKSAWNVPSKITAKFVKVAGLRYLGGVLRIGFD